MEQITELLPCPFCGCEIIYSGYNKDKNHYRECMECLVSLSHYGTSESADVNWNKREYKIIPNEDKIDLILRYLTVKELNDYLGKELDVINQQPTVIQQDDKLINAAKERYEDSYENLVKVLREMKNQLGY